MKKGKQHNNKPIGNTKKRLTACRANWTKAVAAIKAKPKQRALIVCIQCGTGFEVEPWRKSTAKTCAISCRQRYAGRMSAMRRLSPVTM